MQLKTLKIPCSKLQRTIPVRNFNRSIIRALTPQLTPANALAIAGQIAELPIPILRNI
jgi:hypothetical protein